MHEREPESEQRVTNLELFFDLVFVFAITQVTGFLVRSHRGQFTTEEVNRIAPTRGRPPEADA